MALCMESLVASGDALFARDQWGRVWHFPKGARTWDLLPPPAGTVWVDPDGADAEPVVCPKYAGQV